MSLPWFRMYGEFATDPVVQCLSFDDQRHFVMLLCFKCSGLLDRPFISREQRMDVIRKSLGLDGKAWDEMRSRLMAVKLIDDELQPLNWDKRQFLSDVSTDRVRKFRERQRNVSETPSDTDTDTDKNPEGERAPVDKSTARSPGIEPTRTNKAAATVAMQRISARFAQGGGV